MARKVNAFSIAVKDLCKKHNFGLTHLQARPFLEEMGLKLAEKPSEASQHYKTWVEFIGKTNLKYPKNPQTLKYWYKDTILKAGLPENQIKNIIDEDTIHREFLRERNRFDVTKSNYQRESIAQSKQDLPPVIAPVAKKSQPNSKVVAPKPKPKVVEAPSSADELKDLKWLMGEGGVAVVEQKIADYEKLVAELKTKLKRAKSVLNRLGSSAA